MAAILDGPIPGESLTREPGNAPWEQPPMLNTPEEALAFYFEKFEDDEALDDLLFLFEQGMPISTMVESLTTTGVMEGYHSIDVSTTISPVLHIFFVELCKSAKIKFQEDDGPSKSEKKKQKEKERLALMISNILDEEPSEEEDEVAMPMEEPMPDMAAPSPEATPATPPTGNGLVPRSI